MPARETAQTWIEKGAEAFANLRTVEAARYFQKAVEVDPYSLNAQLSLGVIYYFSIRAELPSNLIEWTM